MISRKGEFLKTADYNDFPDRIVHCNTGKNRKYDKETIQRKAGEDGGSDRGRQRALPIMYRRFLRMIERLMQLRQLQVRLAHQACFNCIR